MEELLRTQFFVNTVETNSDLHNRPKEVGILTQGDLQGHLSLVHTTKLQPHQAHRAIINHIIDLPRMG